MTRLQLDIATAIDTWADWASAEIETWPHDLSLPEHVEELLARAFARHPLGATKNEDTPAT